MADADTCKLQEIDNFASIKYSRVSLAGNEMKMLEPSFPAHPALTRSQRSALMKYDERYCNDIIAFMGKGYSQTAFAGELCVSAATISNWADQYPAFAQALAVAKARRVWALEKQFLAAKGKAEVAARALALRNACPEEWGERFERIVGVAPVEITDEARALALAGFLSRNKVAGEAFAIMAPDSLDKGT